MLPIRPLAALAVLGLVQCASVSAHPSTSCTPESPASATAFDAGRWPELVGTYRLVAVNTAPGWGGRRDTATLQLAPNDSAARVRSIYPFDRSGRRYDRVLGGSLTNWDSAGSAHRHPAEVEGTTLYVGCRGCYDASPTQYEIMAVSAAGVWGQWRDDMTGIAMVVDADGRPLQLPNPHGYFCAQRRQGD